MDVTGWQNAWFIKHFSLRAYVRARLLPVLSLPVKPHLHTSHTAFWKTQLSTKCTLISSPHHFVRHICSPFCGSSTDVQASVIARQLFALQRRVPLCNRGLLVCLYKAWRTGHLNASSQIAHKVTLVIFAETKKEVVNPPGEQKSQAV